VFVCRLHLEVATQEARFLIHTSNDRLRLFQLRKSTANALSQRSVTHSNKERTQLSFLPVFYVRIKRTPVPLKQDLEFWHFQV